MPKPLSFDLRSRVLAAVDAGRPAGRRGALRGQRVERDPLARKSLEEERPVPSRWAVTGARITSRRMPT